MVVGWFSGCFLNPQGEEAYINFHHFFGQANKSCSSNKSNIFIWIMKWKKHLPPFIVLKNAKFREEHCSTIFQHKMTAIIPWDVEMKNCLTQQPAATVVGLIFTLFKTSLKVLHPHNNGPTHLVLIDMKGLSLTLISSKSSWCLSLISRKITWVGPLFKALPSSSSSSSVWRR